MLNEKETTRISKFLSLVLRHQPQTIDILIDANGWTDIETLLLKMNSKGFHINRAILEQVVATNNKQRFAFNETKTKIRANQGHSLSVDLNLQPQQPPNTLYHGTAEKNMAAILKEGLVKQNRQHVHLSLDIATALKVGSRHGKPVVLEVNAEAMYKDNYPFFLSHNNVWLTNYVPPHYLTILKL